MDPNKDQQFDFGETALRALFVLANIARWVSLVAGIFFLANSLLIKKEPMFFMSIAFFWLWWYMRRYHRREDLDEFLKKYHEWRRRP